MSDTRTARRWRRLLVAPVGGLALLGLAACGTSGTSTATSTGTTAAQAAPSTAENGAAQDDSAMTAFRTCLANNGVTLPERPARRNGGTGQDGAPPSGAPQPPTGGGASGGTPRKGDPNQAPPGVDAQTWAAAQKACASLAPTPPGGAQAPAAATGT